MNWYLIHTKPRLEKVAQENLARQGYECYLPLYPAEKLRRRKLVVADSPLFPRYLFVRLGQEPSGKSWGPVRSTRGVDQLVCFGQRPAQVGDAVVRLLKSREHGMQSEPERVFSPGDTVQITEGPFAGIEAVYQMPDGESRVLILIEILSRPAVLRIEAGSLRKAR